MKHRTYQPTSPDSPIERYRRAFRALCENSIAEYAAGTIGETPEYLAANDEVAEAKRYVPWWRRALIDRRIIRELDYWTRTGGNG